MEKNINKVYNKTERSKFADMKLKKLTIKNVVLAIAIFTVIQSIAVIGLYLEVLSEDISFSAFLAILLIPVAIEAAIICWLLERRKKNDNSKHPGH